MSEKASSWGTGAEKAAESQGSDEAINSEKSAPRVRAKVSYMAAKGHVLMSVNTRPTAKQTRTHARVQSTSLRTALRSAAHHTVFRDSLT